MTDGYVAPKMVPAGDIPLVFDFDGTLSLADTLLWLRARCRALPPEFERERERQREVSKQAEKIYLWDRVGIPMAQLPFDEDVVAWARTQRDAGRRLLLVTGSAQAMADSVSAHLGLFDAAWGSRPHLNLTGPRKAETLTGAFGVGGYDYVGDSPADLPVWESARVGYCVVRPTTPAFDRSTVVEIASPHAIVDPTGHDYTSAHVTH